MTENLIIKKLDSVIEDLESSLSQQELPAGEMCKCRICGALYENRPKGSRGRPKEYCSKSCRDLENYFLAFEKTLWEVSGRLTNEARSKWINRIMTLRNEV